MIYCGDVTAENEAKHNLIWDYIQDHPFRILILECSQLGKMNTSLNLMKHIFIIILLTKFI